MFPIDHTHDASLQSWVESANDSASNFPIQNLPFCVFEKSGIQPSIGVGIGDQILNLRTCAELGLLDNRWAKAVSQPTLNQVMQFSVDQRRDLRHAISNLLFHETTADRAALDKAMVYQSDVQFLLPVTIGDYTDFYASIYHATNVGSMFRPDNPILPNYKHIPIGYHGRSSSVVVSGTPVKRPIGQQIPPQPGESPAFGPCKLFDYEMEVGCFVAQGNELGQAVSIENIESNMFGMCLLNDWSARDIQKWEYQPLGPFLGKSFATSISPWVVTMEALAPFRCAEFERAADDPKPLDYLVSEQNSSSGLVDLQLEVSLRSSKMREESIPAQKLSSANFTNMYWSFAQMLTHHCSNGCNMQAGDLLGSGTISGPTRDARGSLLELTWDGDMNNPVPGTQRTPLKLPTGEERKFLADGDELIMDGFCEKAGYRRIGFGQCAGIVLPASAAV
jgi:fumarylacetoacetase